LAIHTANEAGFAAGPDYKYGWGVLNTAEAATVLNNALTSNNSTASVDLVYENILVNDQTANFTVTASGNKPLKATIVWTDIKGNVATTLNDTTRRLVNDLDLVIKNGKKTFYPWTLNKAIPDNAAVRAINNVDNVEKVEVDSTIVGTPYTISINHKGTLERGQQYYSLIISGAGGSAYCASTATSNAGTKIDSISINNIQYSNTGSSQYIDNSNLFIQGEPSSNIPVFIKLNSVDATNNSRYVKVFIDYNNNGTFETTETALTSTAMNSGNYTATIALPATLGVGKLMKMRIVAMETNNSADVLACGTYSIGETQDYTLKVVSASNDVQISEIVSPAASVCKKNAQYVTVKVVNNGSTNQSNIPVSLIVKKGNTTILSVNEIFTGRLNGFENMNYTFQKPFAIDANTTYTITATASIANDQQLNNNTLSSSFVSAAETPALSGTAIVCSGTLKLNVTNAILGTNYYWYDSSTLYNPIAIGNNITMSSSLGNKVYLAKGYQTTLPPYTNTSIAGGGSYNSFSGNYMKINTTSALTLETTKLYTGYPGKVEFILGTLGTVNADGSFTYYPIQSVTLNVPASSPTPAIGASPSVIGDTGRIYALDLKIPQAGDYIIISKCDSATLFRNNGAPDPTYPIGPNKVISFTGNSVSSPSNFQNYFYFLYNTQVSSADCMSSPTLINFTSNSKPSITQSGDSLISSPGSTYQWYLNDSLITGANKQSFKPTRNAMYKVATIAGDCEIISDNKLILVTDVAEASAKEISLKITSNDFVENLIRGNSFYIQFSNIQTQKITLEIMNSTGGKVYQKENLVNQRTPQLITIGSLNSGIYFVKIYANNKVYVQRVFITNN
jgi:hypothetical protein